MVVPTNCKVTVVPHLHLTRNKYNCCSTSKSVNLRKYDRGEWEYGVDTAYRKLPTNDSASIADGRSFP